MYIYTYVSVCFHIPTHLQPLWWSLGQGQQAPPALSAPDRDFVVLSIRLLFLCGLVLFIFPFQALRSQHVSPSECFYNVKIVIILHALGYGMSAGVQPAEVSLADPGGWWGR